MRNRNCFAGILLSALLVTGAAAASVKALSELGTPAGWKVRSGDESAMSVSGAGGRVKVELKNHIGKPVRLLLKQPLPVPAGTGLVWESVMRELHPTWMHCLVEDAKGGTYLFYTSSAASLGANPQHKGIYLGGKFGKGLERVGEKRFDVPGFRSVNREFFTVLDGAPLPTPPLKLLGFQFEPELPAPGKPNAIYLRNFRWSKVSCADSSYYYQFDDVEQFIELDGPPHLTLADFGIHYGKKFTVDWELRDDYAGTPLLTGGKIYRNSPEDALPTELQLTKRIEFPRMEEGTYWIRLKLRWSNGGETPEQIVEKEFRLYVIRGRGGKFPASCESGMGNIRIGAGRKRLIWKRSENWTVSVRFPARAGGARKAVLRAVDGTGRELLKKEFTLPAGAYAAKLDLPAELPDVCIVEASESADGKLMDKVSRTVGREPRPDSAAAPVPAGIPGARDIIDGPEPVFSLMPHIGNPEENYPFTLEFMKVAKTVSRQFEYQVKWSECEPLPGIYDFSKVDGVLAEAAKQDLTVLLWPTLDFPEWIPSSYTRNAEGRIFGHNTYLFHGARLNLLFDPVLRNAAHRFFRQVALHTRGNRNVQGYYLLLEHPGEAPYLNWYEGFDRHTVGGFRRHVEKKYGEIGKANRAWRTRFASFDAVMPPTVEETAVPQFRLDWLKYRGGMVRSFLLDGVKILREADSHRLIMVYLDGIGNENLEEFAGYNVMTANGGCAHPEQSGIGLIQFAAAGLPQRAEEISVGQWSHFPYQLDASLFAMLMGGGSNANCKMFIPVDAYIRTPGKSLDAIRKAPYSLDRYEMFMPIWRELRGADRTGDAIRYYFDTDAHLIRDKTIFGSLWPDAWASMALMDSQLPFGIAPGPDWRDAAMVSLLHRSLCYLTRSRIDALEAYVRNGGMLVMPVEAGRYEVEAPDADWVLLRRFGFKPPEDGKFAGRRSRLKPVPGSIFSDHPAIGELRDLYVAGPQPGTTAAELADGTPGVTIRQFGKGKVAVIWAETIMPPSMTEVGQYTLLRDLARWAGAPLTVAADNNRLWTNLLKKRNGETWYLLVMGNPHGGSGQRSGTVRLPALPEGDYRVTELVSRNCPGVRNAAELRGSGLKLSLAPNQIAIYRIEKQ